MESGDDDYTPEDRAKFANLDPSRAAAIDAEILKAVTSTWRKVAYIVGTVMAEIREPDIVVAQRVKALAAAGLLESRGNLGRMRYSEIRLPQ
jgi:hypothetical protein